ncbi:hypothetical protein BGZ54_003409 [Gamsiella multidivaricata]|nr:hypothetical protein BGZ54_003409 [Gamsiella multidivaricata]
MATLQYQRLEFIGDCALDLVAVDTISTLQSSSARNDVLAVVTSQLQLHHHIEAKQNQKDSLKRVASLVGTEVQVPPGLNFLYYLKGLKLTKSAGDLLEAVFGAVFVDSKFELTAVAGIFERCMSPLLEKHIAQYSDSIY